jgi:hypothetical protein
LSITTPYASGLWGAADGPPRIHFSSQDPEKRLGAHGFWINEPELRLFLQQSAGMPQDFDLMFEAKGKDLERVMNFRGPVRVISGTDTRTAASAWYLAELRLVDCFGSSSSLHLPR